MPRADLLALAADDLEALTNRGTVRRAQRELEAGEPTCVFAESESGEVLATWSDGTVCRFPAEASIREAVCSSGATGISRHVVRSVLAYQRRHAASSTAGSPDGSAEPVAPPSGSQVAVESGADGDAPSAPAAGPARVAPWDPGTIDDARLAAVFRKPELQKARARFEQGVLVELVRGPKPVARFLDDCCTLRFMVPGDPRYVHGDCTEKLLPLFVPMAVWAFRELPPERGSGLVSLRLRPLPVPVEALDDAERLLEELAAHGLAHVPSAWSDRAARLEARFRDEGLAWPAEILADLALQHERYRTHDARFEPGVALDLVGELAIRCDAVRRDTGAVPQVCIRGSNADRPAEIDAARLVGLGCEAVVRRRSVEIVAYLQDADTGTVVTLSREFADPPAESGAEPKSFGALASAAVVQRTSLAKVGGGQLLLRSGKRTPGRRLVLPRSKASVAPQAFEWERLKPPVLAEGFDEIAAHLALLPPSALRPRRAAEDVYVCGVARVEEVAFDPVGQALVARLVDGDGRDAVLRHPFVGRGRDGFEQLASALRRDAERLRFVGGRFRTRHGGLVVAPLALVFEQPDGRTALLPWVETAEPDHRDGEEATAAGTDPPFDPLAAVWSTLQDALAELLLTGVRSVDPYVAREWLRLAATFESVNYVGVAAAVRKLADLLSARAETLDWRPAPAVAQLLRLAALDRLARDVPP